VEVQVHYYEDGNVQLETAKEVEIDLKVPEVGHNYPFDWKVCAETRTLSRIQSK
jgi:hypothetical protein